MGQLSQICTAITKGVNIIALDSQHNTIQGILHTPRIHSCQWLQHVICITVHKCAPTLQDAQRVVFIHSDKLVKTILEALTLEQV